MESLRFWMVFVDRLQTDKKGAFLIWWSQENFFRWDEPNPYRMIVYSSPVLNINFSNLPKITKIKNTVLTSLFEPVIFRIPIIGTWIFRNANKVNSPTDVALSKSKKTAVSESRSFLHLNLVKLSCKYPVGLKKKKSCICSIIQSLIWVNKLQFIRIVSKWRKSI